LPHDLLDVLGVADRTRKPLHERSYTTGKFVRSIFKVVLTVARRFCHLKFGDLNLFRISDFEFRICSTYFCAGPKGDPIASGAIEGACRHLVKDRLERTGMRWVREGAQSMLNLRSLWINGEWDDYQQHYVKAQLASLYPNRTSLIEQTRRRLL